MDEQLTLPAVLAALDGAGISVDLDHSATQPVVVFDPPLTAEAAAILEPWQLWLAYVALGRYTRHAPVSCERCAFVSMARVVDGADGWRAAGTCPLCSGRRAILAAPQLYRRRPRRRLLGGRP